MKTINYVVPLLALKGHVTFTIDMDTGFNIKLGDKWTVYATYRMYKKEVTVEYDDGEIQRFPQNMVEPISYSFKVTGPPTVILKKVLKELLKMYAIYMNKILIFSFHTLAYIISIDIEGIRYHSILQMSYKHFRDITRFGGRLLRRLIQELYRHGYSKTMVRRQIINGLKECECYLAMITTASYPNKLFNKLKTQFELQYHISSLLSGETEYGGTYVKDGGGSIYG